MSDTIDGYTPEEWCSDVSAILIIESTDDEGGVISSVSFRSHSHGGSPEWPPLDANGDQWRIETE